MSPFLLATNDGLKPDVRAAVEDASADRILGKRRCEVLVFGSKTAFEVALEMLGYPFSIMLRPRRVCFLLMSSSVCSFYGFRTSAVWCSSKVFSLVCITGRCRSLMCVDLLRRRWKQERAPSSLLRVSPAPATRHGRGFFTRGCQPRE